MWKYEMFIALYKVVYIEGIILKTIEMGQTEDRRTWYRAYQHSTQKKKSSIVIYGTSDPTVING